MSPSMPRQHPPFIVLALRSAVFYCGFLALGAWFGATALLTVPLRPVAPAWHRRYVLKSLRFSTLWLQFACKIRYRVVGAENLPDVPCVLLCQHQSTWDACAVPTLCEPMTISIVIKRELLRIPVFGWGLALVHPIAIDRGHPRGALRKIMAVGTQRLRRGWSVLVFPEGTRQLPGTVGRLSSGGAALAVANKAPVVPIAHNSGEHWPAHAWLKYPGTVNVAIGPPLDGASLSAKDITRQCQAWMQRHAGLQANDAKA